MNQRSLSRLAGTLVLIGIFFGVAPASASADQADYTGHKIVRAVPRSWEQIEEIHALGALLLSEGEGIGRVDYVVAPEAMAGLDAIGVEYRVLNEDVQKLIDEERARLAAGGERAAAPAVLVSRCDRDWTPPPTRRAALDLGRCI